MDFTGLLLQYILIIKVLLYGTWREIGEPLHYLRSPLWIEFLQLFLQVNLDVFTDWITYVRVKYLSGKALTLTEESRVFFPTFCDRSVFMLPATGNEMSSAFNVLRLSTWRCPFLILIWVTTIFLSLGL